MTRFGYDKKRGMAKSGAGALRAAILACGCGSLAALAQGTVGSQDQLAEELQVSLAAAGFPDSEFGIRPTAGQRIRLVAAAPGATGAVRYDWDLNDDGVVDRSGTQSVLEAVFNSPIDADFDDCVDFYGTQYCYFDPDVSVHATDATGAEGSALLNVTVQASAIGTDSIGQYTEVCGDGDAAKEPGERWRIDMATYNGGSVVVGGYALLAPTDRWRAALAGESVVGTFTIDRPAIAIGNLAAYTSTPLDIVVRGPQADITVQIARTTPCGSQIETRSDTGVDRWGSGRFFIGVADQFYLAPPGQCQVYTGCDESIAAIEPREGLYFNAERPGNGISVLLRETAQGTMFFGAWFTGDAHRRPTWYIVQGYLSGNQVVAPIYRFTRQPGSAFAVARTQVGTANVVLIDRERLAFAYTLDNANVITPPRVAELMTHIAPGARATTDATGAYYAASETGWGQVLSEYLGADGADTAFLIQYLYDDQGEPRWVLAVQPTSALATTHPYITFPVHCPGCAWLPDWQTLRAEVGSGSFTFDGPGHARVSTQFTLPAEYGGSWQRNALGVELLTDPP